VGEGLRVKICGLTRREDVAAADRAGADYIGVLLSAGFGRSVDLRGVAELVAGTRARKVAVLVDETPQAAAAAATALGADVLQLHGAEDPGVLRGLRARGAWTLWKAVRARSLDDVQRTVEEYGNVADALLVEGWKEGSLGVGGVRLGLDPARVRALIPGGLDFVLAGGLGPETVADAVVAFRPDVVDVSSGVELEMGVKDHALVEAFVRAARTAAERGAADTHSAAGGAA
jgi:phosphoribosylanthranilate isomerase